MDQNSDCDLDSSSDPTEISPVVLEIFENIFNEAMTKLEKPLQKIKENEFGLIWREEIELHEKVMNLAVSFKQNIRDSLASNHAEAATHVEGSICDMFLEYLFNKLDESLLGEELFKFSSNEIKDELNKKISALKKTLEKTCKEEPKPQSDLEVMISEKELFDPIHIHHTLLCCQLAYNCNDPEYRMNDLEELDKEHLLSNVYVSYENEDVPKYVMAECGDVIYVSFKGLRSYRPTGMNTTHRGEINSNVKKEAEKIPLKYFVRAFFQKKRIIFSGHSSGGAIASLVLIFLLEEFKQQDESYLKSHFKCLTFGLLPVGDSNLTQYVESIPGAKDCFFNIVQADDVIPKLFGTFNGTQLENLLWDFVERVIQESFDTLDDPFSDVKKFFKMIVEKAKRASPVLRNLTGFDRLSIFGIYYILEKKSNGSKFEVLTASEAKDHLTIYNYDSIMSIYRQYVINHSLERYVHEVELAFVRGQLPDLACYKRTSNNTIDANEIIPKISVVHFENIGEEVVIKVSGNNMWFVHQMSVTKVDFDGENLPVDFVRSSGSQVQTRIKKKSITYEENVCVRMKTHFENSKYLESFTVPAKTTTYSITRRQQQLAKLRPSEVIELAYISALLEKTHQANCSIKMKSIQDFLKNAVSVVPIESLFYTIVESELNVMLDCCQILSDCQSIPMAVADSEFSENAIKNALFHLRSNQSMMKSVRPDLAPSDKYFAFRLLHAQLRYPFYMFQNDNSLKQVFITRVPWERVNPLLNKGISRVLTILKRSKRRRKRNSARKRVLLCKTDLKVLFPSSECQDKEKTNTCIRSPITLLIEGKKVIEELSEELTSDVSSSSMNSKMLDTLNILRTEFKTCSSLLGAFMQSQVQIPLAKAGSDSYVNELAKHANSFGLSVWGLLIMPFNYLERMMKSSDEFEQLFIKFSHRINDVRQFISSAKRYQFPDYDEKLEFLVGSMKQGVTCNQKCISYSLERQMERQCSKRNIFHYTSIESILQQWNANFENENLTFVPNEYRPLVARWIKWSLMINKLRETLASQTSIGVVGLINSGKSKLVSSMFEVMTVTGTTDQKRTTVPLIYNLDEHFKGLDIIDFPGVDDRDETIPELAKLLLSLTRIVVFVVDYRKAHSESSKQWLSILEKENVPVLVCLTFGDRLFVELMGKKGNYDVDAIKAGVENEVETIKMNIGFPESSHQRDFKLSVLSFDYDSYLNSEEWKAKLRKVGLCDELDVGLWIAEKLEDQYELHDLSQTILKYIENKESSTLHPYLQNKETIKTKKQGKSGKKAKEMEK